jgi:hypothetical protein
MHQHRPRTDSTTGNSEDDEAFSWCCSVLTTSMVWYLQYMDSVEKCQSSRMERRLHPVVETHFILSNAARLCWAGLCNAMQCQKEKQAIPKAMLAGRPPHSPPSLPHSFAHQYHQPFLRLQSLLVAPFKSSTLSTSTPSLTRTCQTWFRKPRGQLGKAQ